MRMILGGTSGTKPTPHAAVHRASGKGHDKPNEFRPANRFSGNLYKNAKTQVRSPASRPPPLTPSVQWILEPPGPSRQSTQYLHVPAALGRSIPAKIPFRNNSFGLLTRAGQSLK